MSATNDSITVTPGSGATIATHSPGDGKEYQVVMLADQFGELLDGQMRYRLIVPSQAVAANKVYWDFWNDAASGKVIRVVSVFVYPDIDTAVTGVVAAEAILTRTTAIGTGGTAATFDGTSTTAITISEMDTNNTSLSGLVSARSAPTGGATAGAYLGSRWVFTEETNAGSALSAGQGADIIRNGGSDVIVRPGQGLRGLQGTVASVGSLAWEINFELS